MALVGFDKDEIIEFVPEYAGNRDDDNPCIVRLKFVPYSKSLYYSRMGAARTKGTSDPVKVSERWEGVQRKQFTESVESISGYFVSGREVTEAGEFYETADMKLIIEIIKAMESQSKLSEGQKKNLPSASGSSSNSLAEAGSSTVKIAPKQT